MIDKLQELNEYVDMLKNDCEINCHEHINRMHSKYTWCLSLITTVINSGYINDNQLKNSITILKQVIKEAQNNNRYSKTGFCAHEGQDRAHIHSLRYLIVSKIKYIYYKNKNGEIFKFPIKQNTNIDFDNINLIKNELVISLECYKPNNETQIIKLSIVDENIINKKKLKQYDFCLNLNNLNHIHFKKITGIISDDYYIFQDYGLINAKFIEKFINCENEHLIESV